ncbi:hypothetical protein [Leptospira sp. GIMC2001]|uniref:hypothetical protein n=1 Tax=Leptospira sp. GIMC2001 TaxID=1513297 RepID=UPI00234976E1|nr:hypothetical protein [Leptospira sp. GIMC2001]WCL47727.1 hypothetical protein O4O04_00285 [Leptospira sp. GIMC2001]
MRDKLEFFPFRKLRIFSYLIIFLQYFSCQLSSTAQDPIVLPATDIRLEFRGSIQKIPSLLTPPFRIRARAYSCKDWDENYSPRVALREYPECMSSFVEKILEFKAAEYKIDLDVPSDWTHAYVELLDLSTVSGMFSPGYNPNWFSFAKGEIITFRHDFVFRSQENMIPDKKQMELAQKFAPIIILSRDKKEIPTNIEKYYNKFSLSDTTPLLAADGKPITRYEHNVLPYMILPEREDLENYKIESDPTHIYVHARYANTTVSGTQAEALPGYRDDSNYWYEQGDGRIVVSYWFWYDYNHGPSPMGNVHQGDLESYSVLCDPKGNPLRLMVTGHDHIMLDTEWKNINSVNHHPILYIGSGRKSDGGNPTSAYGDYEVKLEAGNAFFNALADPRDIFPNASADIKVIIPSNLSKSNLSRVLIGASPELGEYVNLSDKVIRNIDKLVLWEEPGWINKTSFEDPDGHHKVDEKVAFFLGFNGRIGKHPQKKTDYLRLKQFGISPRNAPFKLNIEQHFTYERPRIDRSHNGREGNYGPKFIGNSLTPQFVEIKK